MNTHSIRKTKQYELPVTKPDDQEGYTVYPTHDIGDDKINVGYKSLAVGLAANSVVKIDGYIGILFDQVRQELSQEFQAMGVPVTWISVADALKPAEEIDGMLEPFLGGDDPVFGKICSLVLEDFFDATKWKDLVVSANTMVIYYGIGASLVPVPGSIVYLDISKNEIQFRARAGVLSNLGASAADDPKKMYKRFYFVDWVVLNQYLGRIIQHIDYVADGQRSAAITWMKGKDWRDALANLSTQPLRARPWFEPGAWGGTWIKENIDALPQDVVNYAWSFELITPENGIILQSSGILLETSFDSLMILQGNNILGKDHAIYGTVFPIRFDFLDTINGGNLSVQCHPQLMYMKEHFGEFITQEETYYIFECQSDAKVYLGFQQDVTPEAFEDVLVTSHQTGTPIDIEKYVQVFPARKHELFLIPPGTVHASGTGNLVLEISSTPYIYTFKMYDWLRVDLDGSPRPLNIARGMQNLSFERKGEMVSRELISKPCLITESDAYALYHLPTHAGHLYDVHRYSIKAAVVVVTNGKVNVLNVVEGSGVIVEVNGAEYSYHYAETFIIPASVPAYTLRVTGAIPVMVLVAFIK